MISAQLQRILWLTANLAEHDRTVASHADLFVGFPEVPVFLDKFSALCTRYLSVLSYPPSIVKWAQSINSSPSIALFALLWLPKTFQAHLLSPLRYIAFKNVFAAFIAIGSVLFALPETLVMVCTHATRNRGLIAKLARLFWVVILLVVSMILAKFKIFRDIVVCDSISMVNYFFGGKKSTDLFLHYEPMLKHISITMSIWVVRRVNQYVTLLVSVFSAFPLRMGIAFQRHINEFGDGMFNCNTKLILICH